AHLLTHGVFLAVQPHGQERTDGGQRTAARQHHPQAPQGPDRGLGLRQRGQVGVDYCRPFSCTGVASHRYPPWGDGRDAISHTMPHGGASCPLFDVSSRHVSKPYPRKGCTWGTSLATSTPCSTSGCPCPWSGHGMSNGATHAMCLRRWSITRATSSAWRCLPCEVSTSHTV